MFSSNMMAHSLFYFKTNFLKSKYACNFVSGGIWCIIIASTLWLVRKWFVSRKSAVEIPGLKTPPFSIFGSLYTFPSAKVMKKLSLSISAFLIQTHSAHFKLFEKEPLYYFDNGLDRMIILRKPEVVEELMKSNRLIRKSWFYKFLEPWLGTGLLTSSGSKWRSRRKLLTPTFHFDILKDFLSVINEQSKILIDILKERCHEDFIDVVELIALCSLDIICSSALGIGVGAQRNFKSEYVRAVLKTSEIIMDRICTPLLWPDILFHLSAAGRQFRKEVKTLHKFTIKVIKQKQAAFKQCIEEKEMSSKSHPSPRKRRKAFMDVLIEHQMKHHDITEEDIREEVDTFVFEGHDTTSVGISWALYLIGLHADVQAKLQEEIDNIYCGDVNNDVTDDDIRDMRYLDCVLKESQRLFPSVPVFGRQVEEDQDFCGYRLKRGYTLLISPYLLHRESASFPNPEKFDPDRFLPENCFGRHPFAYIPFSAGPRNCIGQRFALMEEKVVMANILRNFTIKSLDQRDKIVLASDLVLRPSGPLRLKFTPRIFVSNDAC